MLSLCAGRARWAGQEPAPGACPKSVDRAGRRDRYRSSGCRAHRDDGRVRGLLAPRPGGALLRRELTATPPSLSCSARGDQRANDVSALKPCAKAAIRRAQRSTSSSWTISTGECMPRRAIETGVSRRREGLASVRPHRGWPSATSSASSRGPNAALGVDGALPSCGSERSRSLSARFE